MPLGLVSHPQPLAVATWPVYLENPSVLTEAEETWGREEERLELEMMTDITHQAECGLNQRNMRRLMVTERPVVRLRRETRKSRRSAVERVIELGVFVDSQMYRNNIQGTEADTIDRIR